MAVSTCYAQEKIQLPLKDSAVVYEEVVRLTDTTISSDKLFTQAQNWFANTFKNSKSVLQVNDRQSSKLIGKGLSLYAHGINNEPDTYLYYSIDITVKNGRYRHRIYNIGFTSGTTDWLLDQSYSHYLHNEIHKMWYESKKQGLARYVNEINFANATALALATSIKSFMTNISADNF